MKIIGFEGIVFAGKSTLTIRLQQALNAVLIPEYGVYLGSSKNFPKFPPESAEQALAASNFFLEVEQERLVDLEARVGNAHFALVDRTFLTCIAFDSALKALTGFDIARQSQAVWDESATISPDAWIYLDIDHATALSRTTLRQSVCLPHFLRPEFIEAQRTFYFSAAGAYKPWLTLDGTQSADRVFAQALQFILEQ